ncbi:O-antigen ligase [Paenibacillus sp. 1_12]|uniref:O-antigen ligase family protein n=1 Tax=Paenibacillus sp. 1_12 TaxID=1566278 RepID=UPI0008E800D9|nr:O-antigen ligase family protein [Paenibacillus sp. 1_12]SFK72775.1 O-antigen ligase [Paenibacillus sp. 1_12]
MFNDRKPHVYGKKNKESSLSNDKNSLIYCCLMVLVVLFLLWSPFQRALFNGNVVDFERSIYSALIWCSIALFLISIYFFFNWKWKTYKDALSVAVCLLPVTYLISSFSAASNYYASSMVLIEIMYAAFFIAGAYLLRNQRAISILTYNLLGSGYLITFFGLFNLFGNGKLALKLIFWAGSFPNGIYLHAVMNDSNGFRLTSVFQYANTYAAFLMALLFAALYLVSSTKKLPIVAFHAFMLVPIMISFFLTLSRGAIVIIPILLLIILFFFQLQRQIMYLIYMGIAFAASLIILQKITDAGSKLNNQYDAALSTSSWLLLLGVSLVVTLIIIILHKYVAPILEAAVQRLGNRKYINIIVPVTAIVIGVLGALLIFQDTGASRFLPDSVKNRLENINFAQHSVLERGTFYSDSIKLFKDYPIFGAGGGAWAALYEKYQNNPYVSRQAHNFFLQYLVETGLVGILVALLFMGSIFFMYIRSYARSSMESRDSHFVFLIIALSLLVHSLIDFDLSYVYCGIVLFMCLGAMASFSGGASIKWKWNLDKPVIHKGFPALLLVVSIVVLVMSMRLLSANTAFFKAIEVSTQSNNYNDIIQPLNEAIRLHPNHPEYVLPTQYFPGKIGILLQVYNQNKDEKLFEEAQRLLNELKLKEPHNRGLVAQQIYMYQMKGQVQQAADLAAAEILNYPWDISIYENAIDLKVQMGNSAKLTNNSQSAESNWNSALAIYQSVVTKAEVLKSLPKEQNQGNPFGMTGNIAVSLSQIQYFKGDFAGAANWLKPYVSDQFNNQNQASDVPLRMIARWYLAALQKQNMQDQPLYDKLIAIDPNEKQLIESIVSAGNGVK